MAATLIVEGLSTRGIAAPESIHAMPSQLPPIQFLILAVSDWINRHQQDAIDCLLEEDRGLREQLGGRQLRVTDDQRMRLAR